MGGGDGNEAGPCRFRAHPALPYGRWVHGVRCNSFPSEGSGAATSASAGGARSPAPGEVQSAGESAGVRPGRLGLGELG